ncbi:MAG: class I SAM-dependent methyltransferase [Gammaproteobacteria bacterium]|nr:class I SAM-dependent methyltransferase [Gammaproteobacteria bacterium]
MIRELYYFFRYGPKVQKLQKDLGLVECLKTISKELDADGYAELRTSLVGDLEGDILEIGAGTGATFSYYGSQAKVAAIEPNEELRAAAGEATKCVDAEICVLPGTGEDLSFKDAVFDVVTASLVLCSVISPLKTLEEFKRVFRP